MWEQLWTVNDYLHVVSSTRHGAIVSVGERCQMIESTVPNSVYSALPMTCLGIFLFTVGVFYNRVDRKVRDQLNSEEALYLGLRLGSAVQFISICLLAQLLAGSSHPWHMFVTLGFLVVPIYRLVDPKAVLLAKCGRNCRRILKALGRWKGGTSS